MTLLLIEVLGNLDSNIEDVSCNYRIRATHCQFFFMLLLGFFFNRTGAYLNEN